MAENKDLKLPSRSYLEGFKARNEALWDKIKNNTFVNMVFPVKAVSEGHTEALIPLVVPGGNQAIQGGKAILNSIDEPLMISTSKTLGGSRLVGRPPKAVIPGTNEPITMRYILKQFKDALVNTKHTNNVVQSQQVMKKANQEAVQRAIAEKQVRQDAKKTKSLWDRKTGDYVRRAPEEILGNQAGERLSPYFKLEDYYNYKPSMSVESNSLKCKEKLMKDFYFTQSEFDDLFNKTF